MWEDSTVMQSTTPLKKLSICKVCLIQLLEREFAIERQYGRKERLLEIKLIWGHRHRKGGYIGVSQ